MSDPFGGPMLAFSRKSKFSFETYDAIVPSTRPWLVKNAWPKQGVAFVVGASGAAKTFFTLDATLKVAGGAPKVWGRKAHQCGVVYVAAEDPDGCRARVRAWRSTKGNHRTTPMPFDLVPQSINLLDQDDIEDFKASLRLKAEVMAAEGSPLGLLAIDTFSCCIPGADENSAAEMSRAMEALMAIAREFEILVVVVAHFGKSGADGGIRGWSGLGFNADGTIVLERDKDVPETRIVTFQKVKNGVDGSKLTFRLEEVDLGLFDDDGDPMSSCIVRFGAPPTASLGKRRAGPEAKPGPKLILRAFGQLLDLGQTYVVPPVPGVPPNTSGVERIKLREQTVLGGYMSEETKADTVKRTFNRDLQALLAAGVLREHDGIVWKVKS